MRQLSFAAVVLAVAVGAGGVNAQEGMKPPVAKKEPKVLKIHGYEITDNYAWLRDRGDKKDPEVIKYLEAENAYTEANAAAYKGLSDTLYKEMLGRIKQDDTNVPYLLGGYWYFTKTVEGKQYPQYFRSRQRDGKDAELLLDQNVLAEGHKYFAIGAFEPSDDGRILAFSVDTNGYRQYTLQFKDLTTGQMLADRIERVTSIEWSADGKYVFYSQEEPVSKRDNKVFRHELGSTAADALVFEDKDPLFNLSIGRSRDKKMFFLQSSAATMDEVRYLDAANALGEWKLIVPRRPGHEYSADFDRGEFYILTNKDSENFKVVRAPAADPTEKNWADYIPHDAKVKIDRISFFKDHAVVSEREGGLEYLRVLDRKTRRAAVRIAIVVVVSKFTQGAWIPAVIIPLLVLLFRSIKRHYTKLGQALKIDDDVHPERRSNTMVVLVGGVHAGTIAGS